MGALCLLILASVVWVWFDSSKREWAGVKALTNSAGMWVLGCVACWVPVFPIYLVQRRRAPRRPSSS